MFQQRTTFGVSIEATRVGGVKAFILTPREIPERHKNQLVINLHPGGYVFGEGESGTGEGAMMAAYGGYKVIVIDYRMPPDAPYPAAMDDVMAAWPAVAATYGPAAHRHRRHLYRRRHDARDDAASPGRRIAAPPAPSRQVHGGPT